MSTHRLTIELQEEDYALLRRVVQDGMYDSESSAVSAVISELLEPRLPSLGEHGFDGFRAEILEACKEADDTPESLLDLGQMRDALQLGKLSKDAA